MWWIKVAILSVFITLNTIRGSSIEEKLYNNEIEETKFKMTKSSAKGFKLVDDLTTYRLPNHTIPISYDILLRTKIHEGDVNFIGNVKIHVKIVEATDTITLHYKQLEIETIYIQNLDLVDEPKNATFDYIPSHDFVIIDLNQTYAVDTELLLDIAYKSKLRDDGAGFYYANYTNADNIETFYAATQFEVTDARHAMPCFDEPGIRAVMNLTIVHHKSYSAIANTEIVSQDDFSEDPEYFITKFDSTPVMQTYLLAFVVSDYEYIDATANTRVPQKIYGTPMAIQEGRGDFAASVVGEILAEFEQVLEVKYPLEKMDHIGLTLFNFGAMENFGLITYIDRGLLLNPALSESAKFNQQSSIISLIAHEYAHQWFGNIISPQWWQYTWLNEGFATLFANYVPELLYPDRKFMRNFFTSTMRTAFNSDRMGSWSMNHYTEEPEELWDKFGGIGYQKSSCVLRMFMEVLTPPVFLNGLNIYLNNNFMQAATPAELHAALQQAYDQAFPDKPLNIGNLMHTWENQPGYPLISVSVFSNTIVLKQRRYPESNGELYAVPITFATKTNPNSSIKTPKVWLESETMFLSQSSLGFTPNDWMVVNIDQVGYYRVDYDTTLWRAIIKQLNDNFEVINPINRASLQDELYLAWTEFGRVTGSDVLSSIKYFDRESEAIVWSSANNAIDLINKNLFGTSVREKFLKSMRRITKPHTTKLGYELIDGESYDDNLLRRFTKLWNCLGLDDECLANDYEKLKRIYEGDLDVDLSLCNAMRLASLEDFAKGIDIILNNETYKFSFISTLGCTLEPLNQDELLKVIKDITNNLSNLDRGDLLNGMYKNSENGLEKALSFIDENFGSLVGNLNISQIMLGIAPFIKDEPFLSMFINIANKMVSDAILTSGEQQILINIVADNIQWMEENYDEILEFFDRDEETTIAPTTTDRPDDDSTTLSPTTTTDSAHSIVISIGLITLCVFVNLLQ